MIDSSLSILCLLRSLLPFNMVRIGLNVMFEPCDPQIIGHMVITTDHEHMKCTTPSNLLYVQLKQLAITYLPLI